MLLEITKIPSCLPLHYLGKRNFNDLVDFSGMKNILGKRETEKVDIHNKLILITIFIIMRKKSL